jgi:hypothetical protein
MITVLSPIVPDAWRTFPQLLLMWPRRHGHDPGQATSTFICMQTPACLWAGIPTYLALDSTYQTSCQAGQGGDFNHDIDIYHNLYYKMSQNFPRGMSTITMTCIIHVNIPCFMYDGRGRVKIKKWLHHILMIFVFSHYFQQIIHIVHVHSKN